MVRLLLRAWPGAARVRDAHGDLPLHLAVRHNSGDGALDVAFLVGPRPAPARPAPPARPPAALPYVSAAFLFRDAQTRANAVLAPPLHLLLRDVSS